VLEASGLHKRYGDVVALDGASFAAARGRVMGFLGPNGAGKTTAMRSVFGLVALEAGTLLWDGHPIGREQRHRFGYMPEQRGLYPKMRVGEQLTWLARLHRTPRRQAAEAVGRWLERLGLAERSADRVEDLSHGNQQRVQLAAALIHDPELLVLDEPFSGLDPMGVDRMSEIIGECAAAGTAVVFSSHQLDLVEDICDDVAIINRGRIVLEGPLRDVREAAAHRHLEVEVAGDAQWAPRGDGVIPLGTRDGITAFLVPSTADPADLLRDATAAGRVRRFTFEPPHLSELFREVVSE
jgi:ABC-2 type transport system ATP-binding protein